MAIFRAESLCSPDDMVPWLGRSDPLRVAAKFGFPADICSPSRGQYRSFGLFKQNPFHLI